MRISTPTLHSTPSVTIKDRSTKSHRENKESSFAGLLPSAKELLLFLPVLAAGAVYYKDHPKIKGTIVGKGIEGAIALFNRTFNPEKAVAKDHLSTIPKALQSYLDHFDTIILTGLKVSPGKGPEKALRPLQETLKLSISGSKQTEETTSIAYEIKLSNQKVGEVTLEHDSQGSVVAKVKVLKTNRINQAFEQQIWPQSLMAAKLLDAAGKWELKGDQELTGKDCAFVVKMENPDSVKEFFKYFALISPRQLYADQLTPIRCQLDSLLLEASQSQGKHPLAIIEEFYPFLANLHRAHRADFLECFTYWCIRATMLDKTIPEECLLARIHSQVVSSLKAQMQFSTYDEKGLLKNMISESFLERIPFSQAEREGLKSEKQEIRVAALKAVLARITYFDNEGLGSVRGLEKFSTEELKELEKCIKDHPEDLGYLMHYLNFRLIVDQVRLSQIKIETQIEEEKKEDLHAEGKKEERWAKALLQLLQQKQSREERFEVINELLDDQDRVINEMGLWKLEKMINSINKESVEFYFQKIEEIQKKDRTDLDKMGFFESAKSCLGTFKKLY